MLLECKIFFSFTSILWKAFKFWRLFCCLSMFSYNPLERREACKGGKEATKKPSQPSTKSSTAPSKAHPSHNARKNDASSASTTNPSVKVSRPGSSGGPAYDEKVLASCQSNKTIFALVFWSLLLIPFFLQCRSQSWSCQSIALRRRGTSTLRNWGILKFCASVRRLKT